MASDNQDPKTTASSLTEQPKSQSLEAQKLDLDKNPIKFATHEPGKFELEPHDKPYMEMVLRHGKHSDLVKKILRQRIETRAKDFPRWPGDQSGGVRVQWIESRFWYDRERLSPDFDSDWRGYRAKYIHSLELDPREPVHVPEYERMMLNPIRRFYMKFGDALENYVLKPFSKDSYYSSGRRVIVFKVTALYIGLVAGYYWLRYNDKAWWSLQGPQVIASRDRIYPGDPRYPYKEDHKVGSDFFHEYFPDRTIYRNLMDYEDITKAL